jgi:AbrB family looped-hinge helix DNA binding protein
MNGRGHTTVEEPGMPTNYVMKVSSNGQVSIPAEARTRWNVDQVVVVDLGDRVVLRPMPAEPVSELRGKYRRRGPSSDRIRGQSRIDDAARGRRK